MNLADDVHPRGAIDGNVMELAQDGEAIPGQAIYPLQALDQGHFPQGVVPRQWLRVYIRHDPAKVIPAAIFRQGLLTYVVEQLEALIIHPVGVVKIQRQAMNFAGEHGRQVYSRAHVLDQGATAYIPGLATLRIVNPDEGSVGVGRFVLQIEKGRIHRRKLLHDEGLVHGQNESIG